MAGGWIWQFLSGAEARGIPGDLALSLPWIAQDDAATRWVNLPAREANWWKAASLVRVLLCGLPQEGAVHIYSGFFCLK